MQDTHDIWAELENPPEEFAAIAGLYHWSLNFDPGTGPFALFLDLIGWSEEHIGEALYPYPPNLGYVELSKLADALNSYSARGPDAFRYTERLMELESQQS
jgi:hypothetical protein